DQANGISVRGNNPNTLQWRLEGVEIVNPNHTSNAGTFGDLPTAAGGGVNILSAQLLGNMNFLTGAFPAEYGNVLGGVMDMRLRKGNDTEREYTAQVGFIGIDLSAEGPFSKNSKASYLVNYRYSFTGLLGLGGIDFGGEAIAFQDLSFNISIPTKKAGDFTIFGMGGNSSNVFTSPEDPAEWEEEKSQFNIDFRSKMGAIGVTHEKRFGNILWRNVVAVSGTESERIQDLAQNGTNVQYNFTTKRLISLSSTLQQPLGKRNSIKYGMYATFQKDGLSIREIANQKFSDESTLLQPFASVTFRPFERLTANVGVHYLYYSMSNSISVEPRLSAAYKLSDKQTIAAGYGLHSQQQPPLLYITSRLDLNKAHHFILNHTFTTSKNSFFKTELFYQRLFNIPNIPINQSLIFPASSGINLIDVVPFTQYVNSGNGTNYG
ncbi:MAG: TonB-dependent receptor, partial [Spirosomataceae bacterium]